jgi:hypothetical protein
MLTPGRLSDHATLTFPAGSTASLGPDAPGATGLLLETSSGAASGPAFDAFQRRA